MCVLVVGMGLHRLMSGEGKVMMRDLSPSYVAKCGHAHVYTWVKEHAHACAQRAF